jgi:hypothetical protein
VRLCTLAEQGRQHLAIGVAPPAKRRPAGRPVVRRAPQPAGMSDGALRWTGAKAAAAAAARGTWHAACGCCEPATATATAMATARAARVAPADVPRELGAGLGAAKRNEGAFGRRASRATRVCGCRPGAPPHRHAHTLTRTRAVHLRLSICVSAAFACVVACSPRAAARLPAAGACACKRLCAARSPREGQRGARLEVRRGQWRRKCQPLSSRARRRRLAPVRVRLQPRLQLWRVFGGEFGKRACVCLCAVSRARSPSSSASFTVWKANYSGRPFARAISNRGVRARGRGRTRASAFYY